MPSRPADFYAGCNRNTYQRPKESDGRLVQGKATGGF